MPLCSLFAAKGPATPHRTFAPPKTLVPLCWNWSGQSAPQGGTSPQDPPFHSEATCAESWCSRKQSGTQVWESNITISNLWFRPFFCTCSTSPTILQPKKTTEDRRGEFSDHACVPNASWSSCFRSPRTRFMIRTVRHLEGSHRSLICRLLSLGNHVENKGNPF